MTVLGIKNLVIQIDRQIIISHNTEKIHNIIIHNKTIEVVHLNIKDNITRYNELKKFN